MLLVATKFDISRLTYCRYLQLAAAREEVKNGYTWMLEIAKLRIPRCRCPKTIEDREVVIRYTPFGFETLALHDLDDLTKMM